MKENRNEITIQASVKDVWNVLTDLKAYPEWNPLLCRAEGRVALGEKVALSVKSASNDMNLSCTITKVEENREFAWTFYVFLPFLFRGEHTFRIEPIDEQSVRFVDREIFNGWLVPLQAKDLDTNAKDGMMAMGEALKERVEHLKMH